MYKYEKYVWTVVLVGLILVIGNMLLLFVSYEKELDLYKIKLDKLYTLETVKPSYDYLTSVTVVIETYTDFLKENKEEASLGTGTIIKIKDGYTYILTNKHVIDYDKLNNLEEYSVKSYVVINGKKYKTELVKTHPIYDIAVVKIKAILENKRAIKGINYYVKPSDSIYMVGHHLGRLYIYGEGVFAGWDRTGYGIIQIPTAPGNSGSGVFDKNGYLIGTVFAINYVNFFSYDTAHGVIINTYNIRTFLEGIVEG